MLDANQHSRHRPVTTAVWVRTRPGSCVNIANRLANVDLEPFLAGNFEPAWIEAKLVQDGRVNIGHVMTVFDGVEAQLIGRAMGDAPLEPAPCHPDREANRIVIAAVAPFASRT